VVVSNLSIPKDVLKILPAEVAISRKAIPFEYDSKENEVKIACEDPTDDDLTDELDFVIRDKRIRLYIATEVGLDVAIARHYEGRNVSLSDSLPFEEPAEIEEAESTEPADDDTVVQYRTKSNSNKEVLLVTDERVGGSQLKAMLECDYYKVTITDSADDAITLASERIFDTVFIKDTVPGNYIDLMDRLRKISPGTVVHYYESASSLLLNEKHLEEDTDLFLSNLDLLTSIIASQNKLSVNHGGRVGRYVARLCTRLDLPQREKSTITTAAYIHDLAKFYYHEPDDRDVLKQVARTARLLQSVNYSAVITAILQYMYKDLKGKYNKRLPIEVFGGNIITIVDLFCSSIPPEQKLSLDKFEMVKLKLRELTGRLFLVEIVEAFIAMIQEEILTTAAGGNLGQIMIFSDKAGYMHPVELRLRNENFRIMTETSLETFISLCQRSEPDVIIFILSSGTRKIKSLVEKVRKSRGENAAPPTYLMVKGDHASQLTSEFGDSVEGIIALDANLDILVAEIKNLMQELNNKARQERNIDKSGATGKLSNMNLIDILQAMVPGQEAARITVRSDDNNQTLEMYLKEGKIIFAALDDLKGPEAIYRAVNWVDGIWTMEPAGEDELPQPNNQLSNESILEESRQILSDKDKTKSTTSKF
jgi:DNA-binding response OmpR family regulator